MQPRLFLLTGVSCAGKTTVLARLRETLPPERHACHDIEEHGVPDGAGDAWRCERADHWLRVAAINALSNRSTVLSGTLLPDDVEPRPARSKAPPLRYCLLEADDRTLTRRLGLRLSSPEEREDLRRILGLEPEEFVRGTLRYREELRAHLEASTCDWSRLDTSYLSEDATVAFIREWIEAVGTSSPVPRTRLAGPIR